jgi:hypothetical protein
MLRIARGHGAHPWRGLQISLPARWVASLQAWGTGTDTGSNIQWYSRLGLGLGFRLGKRRAQGIRRIQRAARKDIHIGQKPGPWPALTHQHLYLGTCMAVNQ